MQGSINGKNGMSSSDLEELIPETHFLRKVNQLVDFSFANALTEKLYSPNKGRPSISPELYLRIKLIGHLFPPPSFLKI